MLRPVLLAVVSVPLFCACMVERDYASHADGLDAMSLPTGALVVEQTALTGDIGPVPGLRGESTGTGVRNQGYAQIRVDGETDVGTAFVVFYMDDIGQLRNLRGQGPTTLRADSVEQPISAQGCSDTFAGDHYDAAAEEVVLEVEQTDEETLTVDYEVFARDGNLTESPGATDATGSFALNFSE